MPGIAGGSPIAPGIAAPGKYPQWGVNAAYQIKEAKTDAEKTTLIGQGYMTWFSSASAAKSFAQEQTSILNGQLPSPMAGIAGALEAFYHAATDGKMWRSLGWLILGLVLFLVGVALWLRIPQKAAGVGAAAARAVI